MYIYYVYKDTHLQCFENIYMYAYIYIHVIYIKYKYI